MEIIKNKRVIIILSHYAQRVLDELGGTPWGRHDRKKGLWLGDRE
jgi:hypothetical protein